MSMRSLCSPRHFPSPICISASASQPNSRHGILQLVPEPDTINPFWSYSCLSEKSSRTSVPARHLSSLSHAKEIQHLGFPLKSARAFSDSAKEVNSTKTIATF